MQTKNYLAFGSLGLSLALHLAIFFAISGIILIQAVAPKIPFLADQPAAAADAAEFPPPPELPDDLAPPAAAAPDQAAADEVTAAPNLTLNNQIVAAAAADTVAHFTPPSLFSAAGGHRDDAVTPAATAAVEKTDGPRKPVVFSPFGQTTPFKDGLTGTLYDLKKMPDGKLYPANKGTPAINKLGGSAKAVQLMNETFLALHRGKGDRAILDQKFYRAPTTLYNASIYIPQMGAAAATSAFKSEHLVTAPGWLAHYEGWFTPPASGRYRFVGFADDTMLVMVNGKTVLHAFFPGWQLNCLPSTVSGSWPPDAEATDGRSVFQSLPNPATANKPGSATVFHCRYNSPWLALEKGTAYKIVIVLAESWGGAFSATLGLEQQGVKYPKGDSVAQQTKLPIFKLSNAGRPDAATMHRWPADYDPDGPNFGLSANGVTPP
ncbi:MAG: hypothetical protein LBK60_08570 [Verrucomicrobiales bacterium]|jgi:hypothetical protein|nr:hypothetical protein [Verrucomicrobiales bacterium]